MRFRLRAQLDTKKRTLARLVTITCGLIIYQKEERLLVDLIELIVSATGEDNVRSVNGVFLEVTRKSLATWSGWLGSDPMRTFSIWAVRVYRVAYSRANVFSPSRYEGFDFEGQPMERAQQSTSAKFSNFWFR